MYIYIYIYALLLSCISPPMAQGVPPVAVGQPNPPSSLRAQYITIQHINVYYVILYHIILYYMCYIILHYIIMYHVIVYHITVHHIIVYRTILHHNNIVLDFPPSGRSRRASPLFGTGLMGTQPNRYLVFFLPAALGHDQIVCSSEMRCMFACRTRYPLGQVPIKPVPTHFSHPRFISQPYESRSGMSAALRALFYARVMSARATRTSACACTHRHVGARAHERMGAYVHVHDMYTCRYACSYVARQTYLYLFISASLSLCTPVDMTSTIRMHHNHHVMYMCTIYQ